MKAMFTIGVVVLVLGILSLFVPIPHNDRHSMNAGDVSIGINVKHDEKVDPIVSTVLILGGVGLMIVGSRKSS